MFHVVINIARIFEGQALFQRSIFLRFFWIVAQNREAAN